MNLDDVADEVAEQLRTVDGLRVFEYPADRVTPPFAVVSLPTINYGQTYREGMDRITLPVFVGVARSSPRSARASLHQYRRLAKAALEAGTYTSFDDFKVTSAEPDVMSIGDVEFFVYTLSLDIAGTGAS